MVITTPRKRWKPSNIDACKTLVMFLEKATRGELAILRIAVENAGSERIRLHRSSRDVSVPAIRFSALRATAGKGGSLSGCQAGGAGDIAWVGVATSSYPGCQIGNFIKFR